MLARVVRGEEHTGRVLGGVFDATFDVVFACF